jgi:hypothetical protein
MAAVNERCDTQYVLLSTLILPVLSRTLCSHFGWCRAARSERRRRRRHRRRRRRLYGTRPGFPAIACPILCPSWCVRAGVRAGVQVSVRGPAAHSPCVGVRAGPAAHSPCVGAGEEGGAAGDTATARTHTIAVTACGGGRQRQPFAAVAPAIARSKAV